MKFQVGDKVQIAKCTYKFWRHVGAIGEILELRTYGRHNSPTHYLIKFDCYKIPHIYYSDRIDELCRKYTYK